MKINILGTEWEIVRTDRESDENLTKCDGYTDTTEKKIVVLDVKPEVGSVADLEAYMRKVTRHEIVHAFLFESGLEVSSLHFEEGWATNEETVDWFAIQGLKIYKAWQEAYVL